MNQPSDTPWIHLGECPVCVDGLCRVRTCVDASCGVHFYALCDECEALWLTPDITNEFLFCDPESPVCPICQLPLYGPQAHWSTPADLQGTDWSVNAIYALPEDWLNSDAEQESTDPPLDADD